MVRHSLAGAFWVFRAPRGVSVEAGLGVAEKQRGGGARGVSDVRALCQGCGRCLRSRYQSHRPGWAITLGVVSVLVCQAWGLYNRCEETSKRRLATKPLELRPLEVPTRWDHLGETADGGGCAWVSSPGIVREASSAIVEPGGMTRTAPRVYGTPRSHLVHHGAFEELARVVVSEGPCVPLNVVVVAVVAGRSVGVLCDPRSSVRFLSVRLVCFASCGVGSHGLMHGPGP